MFTDVSVLNIQPSSVQLPSYTAPTKKQLVLQMTDIGLTRILLLKSFPARDLAASH